MDTLHSVLRSIRGEAKSGRDHLTVFREFLSHLDTVRRTPAQPSRAKPSPARRKAVRRKASKRARG